MGQECPKIEAGSRFVILARYKGSRIVLGEFKRSCSSTIQRNGLPYSGQSGRDCNPHEASFPVMKLPGTPETQWPDILDTFELTFAAYDGYLMWMVDLIRALLSCKRIDEVYPGSSLNSLLMSRWHPDLQAGPPFVGVRVNEAGIFTVTLTENDERREVVERRHAASAVKAVRVFLRRLGVRLGPPIRERVPDGFIRRGWLFFPGGRLSEE